MTSLLAEDQHQSGYALHKALRIQGLFLFYLRRFHNAVNFKNIIKARPPAGDYATLVKAADNTYTINYKDGAKRIFTAAGQITAWTDLNGNTQSFVYDASGNLASVTDTAGNRNLTKETAPDGSVTSYTNDAAGNRLSTTDALGKTTTYSYNSLGQVTSSTDPLGHTTTNTYDDKGKLTQTLDPLGARTSYVYDGRGNLTSVTNALNQTSSFSYDAAGNQTSSTDPSGATTTLTYDAMGNMLTQKDALGKVTTFEYDGRYRLAKSTDPLGNATSYAYDLKGNKTSQTDANGNVTRYEYDLLGHLVKSVDALNNANTNTYGGTGCASCGGGTDKLTSVTDAKGQTTSYQYDLLGRLIKETDPLGKATLYGYDAVGNLISKTDANGATLTYAYDAIHRLTKKNYPDTSSESYTYDAVGRMLTTTNAIVAYSYVYDMAGRVTSFVDSRGYSIAYSNDLAGNRSKMTLQAGTADERITSYSYDAAGRVSGITSNAGTFAYGYDTLGRRVSLAYPNGITANYGYDSAGRLTSLTHGTVASFSYTLDKVGNRTSKTTTEVEKYLYDSTYRLLGVVSTKPEAFSYDAVGNRLTGPGAKDIGYLYNAGSQMLKGRKLNYGYDSNGNQTTRDIIGAADKSWSLTWDYENRLVKMEKQSGAEKKTVRFSYDPQGRRIGKQVTTVIDGVTKTETHVFIYDNENIILETFTDGSGTSKTFFTHSAGADEHLAIESNQRFSYYHADGLGSAVTISDRNKRVVQSYEYDSFGMMKPSSSSFGNSYTYTGREWDKETGLYYYRARYYDPIDGRFISKDPIGIKGGVNQYAYVNNNVINSTDPLGLFKYHGNWCGPNWTGGKVETYSPDHKYLEPVDTLDTYCMIHDMCYAQCRADNPCSRVSRGSCMTKCDRELADGAALSGNKGGLWSWMKFNSTPDPGPNADCCKDK